MMGLAVMVLEGIIALFVLCILLAVYFLPYIVARHRKHRNAPAIFVLNLLLGWTFIGWAVSLVWAVTKP